MVRKSAALTGASALTGIITLLGLIAFVTPEAGRLWESWIIIFSTLVGLALTRFFAKVLKSEIQLQRPLNWQERRQLLKEVLPLIKKGPVPGGPMRTTRNPRDRDPLKLKAIALLLYIRWRWHRLGGRTLGRSWNSLFGFFWIGLGGVVVLTG